MTRSWLPVPPSLLLCTLTLVGVLALPANADAQFWKELGFGVAIGVTEPTDGDVGGAVMFGGEGGRAPRPGWGFAVSLDWFTADLEEGGGAPARRIGDMRVRPLTAGAGYTWMHGRLATTAALTAGISINSARLDEALTTGPDGSAAFALDVNNSFALRPMVELEYFVSRKFALLGTAGYLFTRPEVTFSTPTGRVSDRWNASSVSVLGGIVVYPFR